MHRYITCWEILADKANEDRLTDVTCRLSWSLSDLEGTMSINYRKPFKYNLLYFYENKRPPQLLSILNEMWLVLFSVGDRQSASVV